MYGFGGEEGSVFVTTQQVDPFSLLSWRQGASAKQSLESQEGGVAAAHRSCLQACHGYQGNKMLDYDGPDLAGSSDVMQQFQNR